jgi:hypothetical protein
MRDPLDELSDLRTVDVTPFPAEEVRARGDRLRRRRATLTVLWAAASIALIAGVVGVVFGEDAATRPSPPPATSSPSPVSPTIPDDFPLAAGLPATNEDGTPVEVTSAPGVEGVELCGETALSYPGAADVAGTTFSAPEDHRTRTLFLFADPAEASTALSRARGAFSACPVDKIGGTDQVYEPAVYRAGDEAAAFTQSYRTGGRFDTGLTVYLLVRVGNALLVTTDYAEAGGGGTESAKADFVELVGTRVQPVVEAMRVFVGDDADAGAAIPEDFPLDLDQLTMARDGGQVTGPAEDAPGVEVIHCGEVVWPVSGQDRLASYATGAEHVDARELLTFLDAEAATNVLTALRQRLQACPRETVEGPVGDATLVHEVLAHDVGYDSVTVASYLEDGAPGLTLLRFVRVGNAVLAESLSGEGNATTVDANLEILDAVTLALAAEMCVFTEAGCEG